MSAAPVNLPRESVLFSRLINTITELFEPGCALMTWYIKVIALIAHVLLSIAVQSAICIFCAENWQITHFEAVRLVKRNGFDIVLKIYEKKDQISELV